MGVDWLVRLRPSLTGLFALCLGVSAADALFDGGSEGFRLACGLSMALCLVELISGMLG